MIRLGILAPLIGLATGCIVNVDGPGQAPNLKPEVVAPLAGCYWSPADNTYVWYFDTYADDPDGAWDVDEVWADVYDLYYGDAFIQSFPLYRTNDPSRWYSDWLGWSTSLDCRYGGYVVDIVAYDAYGAFDLKTVTPIQ